jgi:hypothetical protein
MPHLTYKRDNIDRRLRITEQYPSWEINLSNTQNVFYIMLIFNVIIHSECKEGNPSFVDHI